MNYNYLAHIQWKPHPVSFVFLPSSYKWMTYGEAGTARSGIGSGLIYHGIPKV